MFRCYFCNVIIYSLVFLVFTNYPKCDECINNNQLEPIPSNAAFEETSTAVTRGHAIMLARRSIAANATQNARSVYVNHFLCVVPTCDGKSVGARSLKCVNQFCGEPLHSKYSLAWQYIEYHPSSCAECETEQGGTEGVVCGMLSVPSQFQLLFKRHRVSRLSHIAP